MDRSLFNDAVSITYINSVELYGRTITFGELKRIEEEVVVACFSTLSQHSAEAAEKRHNTLPCQHTRVYPKVSGLSW